MALVFAIMHLVNFFDFVTVHSFTIFYFNMVSVNLTEWSTIPACPSLMCSFNRGNIEESNSESTFLFYVCVCMFCFMFVWGFSFVDI